MSESIDETPIDAQRYLTQKYLDIPGFSSLFSAQVAVNLLKFQESIGVQGNVGEIGVLLGRSFIALALAATSSDICLAVDNFLWPADAYRKFLRFCGECAVDMSKVVVVEANSIDLKPSDLRSRLGALGLRYLHIDGGHSPNELRNDLELANELMECGGIICLDDMLHAQYPELGIVVADYLTRHPDFIVFCIVDRVDLIGASKYMICRSGFGSRYIEALKSSFGDYVFAKTAEFDAGPALILSKDAPLLDVYLEKFDDA